MNYTPPKPVPESIAASLARSEAQIAAGQPVPFEPVLDRLRSSIARMQADEKLKTPTRGMVAVWFQAMNLWRLLRPRAIRG
jgi:hypothetical protein